MPRMTILLARSIGIFMVLLIAAIMLRGMPVITATLADGPVMLAYGIFSLAAGIAMVIYHNVWTGGPVP